MSITSERLKIARERKGLKQTQVKDRTGIHNKTLSGYENNVAEPDLKTLRTLAEVYEVSVEWLIGNTDDPKVHTEEEQSSENTNKLKVDIAELEKTELFYKGKKLSSLHKKALLGIFIDLLEEEQKD
jgi:transcriptional regulator with XRE-family HTH domain